MKLEVGMYVRFKDKREVITYEQMEQMTYKVGE